MRKLLYIELFPLLLLMMTACHGVEKSADSLSSDSQLDSILRSKVCEFMHAFASEHQMYALDESTILVSPISNQLFESWYDEGCYLLLVDRKDTTVLDILYDMPVSPRGVLFLDGAQITDSAWIELSQEDEYHVVEDKIIIDRYTIYTYHQSDRNTNTADTLYVTKTETRYRMENGNFVYEAQKDSVVSYERTWRTESIFSESDYNERLYSLYKRICAGETISNDELLEAMPQSREQFYLACPEGWYDYKLAYNRANTIEQMAYERAAEDFRFMDAFIKEALWADGIVSSLLFEVYFPKFRTYDSVYFDSVAYQLLPPCSACIATHDIEYECPECE